MRPGDPLVDDLADAILDGTPIDWAAAESSPDGTARPLVSQLRVLAAVAALHRGTTLSASTLSKATPSRLEEKAADAPVLWGHLRLVERIGRGAFGELYRAWDTRLDREVALKLLPAGPSSGDRVASAILQEGRLLARVRHPNVVTIYGAEQIADQIGLWMEFVRGHTLEQILDQRKVVSAAEAVGIGLELCRAMSAVHGAGLLHRDIKTHNVMRAEDGRIVLMDFGTGRDLEDDAGSDLAGTPLYLAPEVLEGQPATVRSDIYSLGVLLYHLVTGAYPVHARTLRELRRAHERGERTAVQHCAARCAIEVRPRHRACDRPRSRATLRECRCAGRGSGSAEAAPENRTAGVRSRGRRRLHSRCRSGLGSGWPSGGIVEDAQRTACRVRRVAPWQRRERQPGRATRRQRRARTRIGKCTSCI